ncbi:MAG: 50S ribosomal protein L17 [Tenericutes bacterium HGW-Tenericutes-6]|nr:MAG: 50S ribosomal protein L17 [Tenericutes bacterium HGW-Tenericutes-6]
MGNQKLGRPTDQRLAVLRNQASYLLWYGRIETTLEKAKAVQSYAEKIITLAVNSYKDTIKVQKEEVDAKGNKVSKEVINDGQAKLHARRQIMRKVYPIKEQQQDNEKKADFVKRTEDVKHPLVEKIFNVYAPKYDKRKEETGNGGGYTRVIKTGTRKGDNAALAIIELI